mmetsp:Transcript_21476/g.59964  ORF Transcript_21476/g.59964 Transcript_21476/m.59964 type:complete len:288 (+) Transcript_21476:294-1157(+)
MAALCATRVVCKLLEGSCANKRSAHCHWAPFSHALTATEYAITSSSAPLPCASSSTSSAHCHWADFPHALIAALYATVFRSRRLTCISLSSANPCSHFSPFSQAVTAALSKIASASRSVSRASASKASARRHSAHFEHAVMTELHAIASGPLATSSRSSAKSESAGAQTMDFTQAPMAVLKAMPLAPTAPRISASKAIACCHACPLAQALIATPYVIMSISTPETFILAKTPRASCHADEAPHSLIRILQTFGSGSLDFGFGARTTTPCVPGPARPPRSLIAHGAEL